MAITLCKECKKEVSDTAASCPHCGVLLPGMPGEDINTVKKRTGFLQSRWVAGVTFWPGVVLLLIPVFMGEGKEQFAEAWDISKWLIGFGVLWYLANEIERNLFERKQSKKSKLEPKNTDLE